MEQRGVTIIYEDEALLVCVKPRGLLSASDASQKPAVSDFLLSRTVFPVHRLDRDACGLLLLAKTREAAAFLSGAMHDSFCKEYLALCEGTPPQQGQWTDLLFHDRTRNKTYVVRRKRGGVKEARLSFCLLRAQAQSLVKIRLFTGRTHQIRVQFASRGYPLVGDKKYGAASGGALQLYAWRLTFPHPDGRTMCFTLPQTDLPEACRFDTDFS